MKNLIYYPTFEPKDLNWLKYALIYVDQFSPIIPKSGFETLSKTYQDILETDLIEIHDPNYNEGVNASINTLKEVEFIQQNPDLFRDKFDTANVLRTWQDRNNWTFKLYREKFNEMFESYCIKSGFGRETKGGLLLSKELAQLYMTFLAEEIAQAKKGNPITDSLKYDNLSTYLRTKDVDKDALFNASKIITSISLPKNINEITIDKLIAFRNDSGISELRKSFNSNLENFYSSLEEDFDGSKFLKHLQESNSELSKEIALFFGGLISTTLGGLILINPNNLEIAQKIIEGSLLIIGGSYAINKSWTQETEKKNARKFLSRIEEIK